LITEPEILFEQKHKDPIVLKNHVNLIISSNNDWVVPAGKLARRFCVLDVSPARIGDNQYFDPVYDQMSNGGLEAMMYDLLQLDISNVDLRKIPKTGALFEQIVRSFDSVNKFWFETLVRGFVDGLGTSWKSPIKKDDLYEAYRCWCGKRNRSDIVDDSQFWKEFRGIFPNLKYPRPRKNNPGRKTYVQIPSLKDCKDRFSEVVGMPIPWKDYR
jgi:hypothetical protein